MSASQEIVLAALYPDTRRRLTIFVDLLLKWQKTINLVAPSSLADLWTRHIEDSFQVQRSVPEADIWADFGSGGGFPGLITAVLLAERPSAHIHLVESDKRKAAFLQTVSRETDLKTTVHAIRIEAFAENFTGQVDAVSARALAPLPKLLDFAEPFLRRGAVGVFPKGQTADAELTALSTAHRFDITSKPSRTDPTARLLLVRMPQS